MMLEILRDQIWQFAGAAFGFATIILSIVLYRTQRRRKALSFDIITFSRLLSVDDQVKGRVKILFDDKPIQDVHLITFKFINSGDIPIIPADYVRPLGLGFGESAQVLTAEVIETNPGNLQASVAIEATRVVLEPILLNSGDSITFKSLVSRLDLIDIDGRIIGVTDIPRFVTKRAAFLTIASIVGILLSCIVFLLLMIGLALSRPGSPYGYLGNNLFEWGIMIYITILVISSLVIEFGPSVKKFVLGR